MCIRDSAGVEHRRQRLQGFHAHAGMAAQQRVDADAQHRPHDVRRERLADADRVADDEVALQFLVQRTARRARARQFVAERMRAQQLVGVAAEAGGDAVDGLLAPHLLGQKRRGMRDVAQRALVEHHLRAVGDLDQPVAGLSLIHI